MKNVFEQILDGDLPSEKVFESDTLLAIKDLYPVAPVHLLILPKKKGIKNLQEVVEEDLSLVGEIIRVAQKLAREYGVENNYRLLSNVGRESGQTIFHLHFHLIGGRTLGVMG